MFFVEEIQDILGEKVLRVHPGAASPAVITTEAGAYFVKYVQDNTEAFYREAKGLEAMRKTGSIDVVGLRAVSSHFILLDYLNPKASPGGRFFSRFWDAAGGNAPAYRQGLGIRGRQFFGGHTPAQSQPHRVGLAGFFLAKALAPPVPTGCRPGMDRWRT